MFAEPLAPPPRALVLIRMAPASASEIVGMG